MPWQNMVADVAGEVDPVTNRLWYSKVVVLVPRQSGKTTEALAQKIYRAWAYGRPQEIVYTAQKFKDARKRWLKNEKALRPTVFAGQYKLREAQGSESITWANGSEWRPGGVGETSGHGDTLDLGEIDEAFAQIDFRQEQALRPAMSTRDSAQLWVYSTAGTLQSIYLNQQIAEGRERTEAGDPGKVAYIEYSAGPDDDPGDIRTWFKCMPALGFTIDLDFIQNEWDDRTSDRDFARAYLNLTDEGETGAQIVDNADWTATADDSSAIVGLRSFALDITNDRSWASVGWAGENMAGQNHFELIKHERGTHWIKSYLVQKVSRQRFPTAIAVVGGSQAALMQDDLEKAGLKVLVLSKADYAAACAKTYDGIIDHTVRHLETGQIPLDVAIGGAAWGIGDARTWSRTKSTTIISPLVACSVANWAFTLASANQYDVLDSVG